MNTKINLLFFLLVAGGVTQAKAQQFGSGNAQQAVQLGLAKVIDISFVANNSNIGNLVSLVFNDVNDYMNGVESPEQGIRVSANTEFNVYVEVSANNFTYTGPATSGNVMPVNNVLRMKVTQNNTGGTITSGFGNNFQQLTKNDKKVINKGDAGGDRTFAVQYRATPGFAYAAGTYTVDVIYTATEQ